MKYYLVATDMNCFILDHEKRFLRFNGAEKNKIFFENLNSLQEYINNYGISFNYGIVTSKKEEYNIVLEFDDMNMLYNLKEIHPELFI